MMKLIKKFLTLILVTVLFISMSMTAIISTIHVTFASPGTNIYVNPSVKSGVMPPNTFKINISVTEAPASYAWETFIEWDPALLNLTSWREGDFLHRWVWDEWEQKWVPQYQTTLLYSPITFNEININGKIKFVCTLFGDVPWAGPGNGWLLELEFKVKAQGSTLINLYDTSLYDHYEGGAPAPALYPNSDCFFYNRTPPIHDIKVYDIKVIDAIVHLGEVADINITVLNEGTATESFTLNVYAATTLIGTTTVSSLSGSGNFEARSFTYALAWATTGSSEGNYTVSASVPTLPGEIDTADNTRIDGKLPVTFVSDITGPQSRPDGKVNKMDLSFMAQAYGKTSSDPNWSEYKIADITGPTNTPDGKVDIRDMHFCGRQYTRSLP